MSTTSPLVGQLFTQPFDQPLSVDGRIMPLCYRMFYLTNSTTLATVYQDSALTTPYAAGPVIANSAGQFSPIYLNPSIEYRSQLFNAAGQMQQDADTVNNNAAGTPFVAGDAYPAYKATSTARGVTGGLVNDPDLSVAIPGAGIYRIDADLVWTTTVGGTTVQENFLFTGTLAVGGGFGASYMVTEFGVSNSVLFINGETINSTGPTTKTLGTTAVSNTTRASGTFQALTGGTLVFQWGTIAANSVSLLAGSSMTVTRVA